MAKKMSAKAMMKMEVLEESKRKVERISSLTEQYVGARSGQDQFLMGIIRAATTLQRTLMMNGYGVMADTANNIVMLARRGGTPHTKGRNLREQTGSLTAAIERAVKATMNADKEDPEEAAE